MMDNEQTQSIVAVYDTHAEAEAAIKALSASGLDMTRMSILGKDYQTEEHATGFYNVGDKMVFWGANGAFWGALWGMLAGTAYFVVPTVGPLVVMGQLAGWFVGAVEGAALGGTAGVLGAALANIGVPKDSVVKYETEIRAGKFVVVAHGGARMIDEARAILGSSEHSGIEHHAL